LDSHNTGMSVRPCGFVHRIYPTVEHNALNHVYLIGLEKLVEGAQTNLVQNLIVQSFRFGLRDESVLELLPGR